MSNVEHDDRGNLGGLVALALAIALAIGLIATILGAVLHKEERTWCLEGATDCVRYHNYGWPWEWRTSMPDRALEVLIDNSECGFFCVNERGYSSGWFLFTATVWFVAALAAEAVVALIAWPLSALLVKRRAASA